MGRTRGQHLEMHVSVLWQHQKGSCIGVTVSLGETVGSGCCSLVDPCCAARQCCRDGIVRLGICLPFYDDGQWGAAGSSEPQVWCLE